MSIESRLAELSRSIAPVHQVIDDMRELIRSCRIFRHVWNETPPLHKCAPKDIREINDATENLFIALASVEREISDPPETQNHPEQDEVLAEATPPED